MRPTEWLKKFLETRNLNKPDSRPLYKYRMTTREFAELQYSLKTNPLNPDSYQNWDTCFVLFAAEWWNRNYAGSQWGWDGILDDIALLIEATARGRLVTSGIKKLNRTIYHDPSGSNNYIGTIALEAGIPTRSLEREGRWLSRLIRASYDEYVSVSSSSISIVYSIANHAERLYVPQTFRKDAFYKLIEIIVRQIFELKKKYSLGDHAKPLEYLGSMDPDWKNSFPINVESKEGINFLNALLTEIASIKEVGKYPIGADRKILAVGNHYSMNFELILPATSVSLDDLRIPKTIQVRIENASKIRVDLSSSSGEAINLGYAYLGRRNEQTVIELPRLSKHNRLEHLILDEFELILSSQGQVICKLPVCEELNKSVPWSFVDDTFYGQASVRTSASELIVIVGQEFRTEGNVEKIGKFHEWANVFHIKDGVVFQNDEGERFRITANSQNKSDTYSLSGARLPEYISAKNVNVFVGAPRIWKMDEASRTLITAEGSQQFRPQGTNQQWNYYAHFHLGHVDTRLQDTNGDTLFHGKVFLLPKDFEVKLFANNRSPQLGTIEIRNAQPFHIQLISSDVESTIENEFDFFRISLASRNAVPPQRVVIKLFNQSLGSLAISVPFPSTGAQIFNNSGAVLKRSQTVSLNELHGIRIYLYNNPGLTEKFILRLRILGKDMDDLYFEQVMENLDLITEFSLSGLKDEMDKLFAVVPDLDKTLIFEVLDSIRVPKASVLIKQYAMEFTPRSIVEGKLKLGATNKNKSMIMAQAFRLDVNNNGTFPIDLCFECSNGSDWINYEYIHLLGQSGTWFIYPNANSSLFFRPFAVILSGGGIPSDEIEYLKDAALLPDFKTRVEKITNHGNKLASEFDHSDWNEIKWLWKYTSYLPMASLNVWTAFSQNEKARVAMYCNFESKEILDELTSEYPVLWEVINIRVWTEALTSYHSHLQQNSNDEVAEIVVRNKISDLGDRYNLRCLRSILETEVLQLEGSPDIPSAAIKFVLEERYKDLISRLHPDQIPNLLIGELTKEFKKLPDWLQSIVPEVSFKNYKPIVYLPILLAHKSIQEDSYPNELTPLQVYKMRRLKSHNEEWFHTAYDIVQGYCWNKLHN